MSKHSLAPGFVLQRLDDKGRARWELNRPAEEEKKKKKKWERATGWRGGVKHDRPGQWVGVWKKKGGGEGEEGRLDKK